MDFEDVEDIEEIEVGIDVIDVNWWIWCIWWTDGLIELIICVGSWSSCGCDVFVCLSLISTAISNDASYSSSPSPSLCRASSSFDHTTRWTTSSKISCNAFFWEDLVSSFQGIGLESALLASLAWRTRHSVSFHSDHTHAISTAPLSSPEMICTLQIHTLLRSSLRILWSCDHSRSVARTQYSNSPLDQMPRIASQTLPLSPFYRCYRCKGTALNDKVIIL